MGMLSGYSQQIALALPAAPASPHVEVKVLAVGLARMRADGCKTAHNTILLASVLLSTAHL